MGQGGWMERECGVVGEASLIREVMQELAKGTSEEKHSNRGSTKEQTSTQRVLDLPEKQQGACMT